MYKKKFITTPKAKNSNMTMLACFTAQQKKQEKPGSERILNIESRTTQGILQRNRSANQTERKLARFDSGLQRYENSSLLQDNKSQSDEGFSLQSFEDENVVDEMKETICGKTLYSI